MGTKIITKYPLAEMQYFDCTSASGTAGSGSNSRKGGGNVNFHVHLRLWAYGRLWAYELLLPEAEAFFSAKIVIEAFREHIFPR